MMEWISRSSSPLAFNQSSRHYNCFGFNHHFDKNVVQFPQGGAGFNLYAQTTPSYPRGGAGPKAAGGGGGGRFTPPADLAPASGKGVLRGGAEPTRSEGGAGMGVAEVDGNPTRLFNLSPEDSAALALVAW